MHRGPPGEGGVPRAARLRRPAAPHGAGPGLPFLYNAVHLAASLAFGCVVAWLIHQTGALPATLADTDLARDLLASTAGISARDALHGAVMTNRGAERGAERIATPGRGFGRIGRVARVER